MVAFSPPNAEDSSTSPPTRRCCAHRQYHLGSKGLRKPAGFLASAREWVLEYDFAFYEWV